MTAQGSRPEPGAKKLSQEDFQKTIQNLLQALPRLVEQFGLERGFGEFKRRIKVIYEAVALLGGDASDIYSVHWKDYWKNEYERVAAPAKQGDAEAQYTLAMYYGLGPPSDYIKAVKWLQISAKRGNLQAQLVLGHGKYVRNEYTKAAYWYRLAAAQGNIVAQDYLGIMYYHGMGVPQDYTEALRWLGKAAEKGAVEAQNNLAYMYYHGMGVPKDFVQAYVWSSLAVANFPPSDKRDLAAKGLDNLATRMTHEQIAEAQRITREWWKRHRTRERK